MGGVVDHGKVTKCEKKAADEQENGCEHLVADASTFFSFMCHREHRLKYVIDKLSYNKDIYY